MELAISIEKYILAPLGITAAASAFDAGIQEKNTWFRNNNFNNLKND